MHNFDQEYDLIYVYAGSSGDVPVHEELPARQVEPGVYKLLASPGLTLNLAKGNLVRTNACRSPNVTMSVQCQANACARFEVQRLPS
ncbi:hypothetical protein CFB50_02195 [Burkholderia sp. AU33423]|uniref:hypothetical protein n=1 Tax=Burkholderia TaxID=32008 RepID=UPI000B7A5D29|nr:MULTISPECIES: hypothetical protein [Burkholderia]OXI91322.1 hypothetical protein CFB50_02195 [Burkholderia sp. AU33423]